MDATIGAAIIGGVAAFGGAGVGGYVATRASRRESRSAQRADVLEHLRWAADMALDSDPLRSEAGVAILTQFVEQKLVREHDETWAVAKSVVYAISSRAAYR